MYDYNSPVSDELLSRLADYGNILMIVLLIFIALVVFIIIAEWKFFKKCGKQGWECIVPFYNQWVLVEIAGLNWWWFLVLIASSIVSLLFGDSNSLTSIAALATVFGSFVCNYNIAKKFHKETGFAVLMTLFPIVVIPIMAFSNNYQYDNSVTVSKNGLF